VLTTIAPRNLSEPETVRRLVRSLREGVCLHEPDGTILDANPALLELFGARTLAELDREDVRELFADSGEKSTVPPAVRGFEIRLRRLDGETRTALVTAYHDRDPVTGDGLRYAIVSDITERKKLETQLLEQALRDPLTGCYNRRYLAQVALSADETTRPWGCIVLDLDEFKSYNDEHGHEEGDRALVTVSRFLMRRTRASEAVVRMGGDEFLLLLPGADRTATEIVADRLRLAASREVVPAFSLGFASREEGESLLGAIDRADQKLLIVKSAGRGPRRRRREAVAIEAM